MTKVKLIDEYEAKVFKSTFQHDFLTNFLGCKYFISDSYTTVYNENQVIPKQVSRR